MSTETEVKQQADEFDTFFDNLSALKPGEQPPADFGAQPVVDAAAKPADQPVVDAAAKAADQPVVDTATPVEGEVVEAPAADEDAAKAAADAKAAEEAAKAPKQPDTEALLERFVKAMEAQKSQPQAKPQAKQPVAPPLYTEDELGSLRQFATDYPDLANAMSLMMRGNTAQNNALIFNEMGKVLGPQLQQVQEVVADSHTAALIRAVPDYMSVAPKVVEWAEKTPATLPHLRAARLNVIDGGTVEEVTDLINTWRQATGSTVTAPAVTGNPAAGAKESGKDLSEAAKQAAASLAPVGSKRTVQATSQPTDFDGSFEAFSKQFAAARTKP